MGHSWVWDLLYHGMEFSIWANGAVNNNGSFYTWFPHWLPSVLCSAYILLIASLLLLSFCLMVLPCVFSPRSSFSLLPPSTIAQVLSCPWLQFLSLYSVSLHIESQFHSFTHQSAALGCDSFRLCAPVTLHEEVSHLSLYFELRQDMRPFSKGKVVRQ